MSKLDWNKTRISSLRDRDRRQGQAPENWTPPTRMERLERALVAVETRISNDEPWLSEEEVFARASDWIKKKFK